MRNHKRTTLRNELGPHFVAEEEHLFPVLLDAVDEHVVAELLADHRELERLAGATTAEELTAFADLLERHIRREEREVFPVYQDHIPAERREQGHRWTRINSDAGAKRSGVLERGNAPYRRDLEIADFHLVFAGFAVRIAGVKSIRVHLWPRKPRQTRLVRG